MLSVLENHLLIQFLIISQFRLSFFIWVFADCAFQRSSSFHLGYQTVNLGLFIVLLLSFDVYGIYIDVACLIYGISNFAFVSPISLTKGLFILLIFSRDQLLISLTFLYYLPVFNFIDLCSTFYYFFSLVTLDMIYHIFQVSSDKNLDNWF